MVSQIKKRDESIVLFNKDKITNAIFRAATAMGGKDKDMARSLADAVAFKVDERFKDEVPNVEEVQDIIEDVLIDNRHSQTAKAYIRYRQRRKEVRDAKRTILDVDKTMQEYLGRLDWRVNENSNVGFSLGGLILYVSGKITANYWLNNIYPPEVKEAHINGDFHIHDLSMFSGYCGGWSLKQLLMEGFGGVAGQLKTVPPKHFDTVIGQMVNFLGTMQNEWAGAMALSSVDTYLAPYVRKDNMSYKQVKQQMQRLLFNIATPSRWGTQTPFINFTFDWTVPEDMKEEKVLIGGDQLETKYKDYQKEMDMINRAFLEGMVEGDAAGRIFTFPIPTYNVTKDFDWDSENSKLLFDVTAKYGIPYFQNFINSSLKPSDVRSMCCRLQLDVRKLRKKTGGLFGSGELTGSIGVVTINMPRLGYLSKSKEEFFDRLGRLMDIGKNSLEIKRKVVTKYLDAGLLPYSKRYLGSLDNHFSTIGLVGMNEALLNFIGKDIATDEGKKVALEILDFMREKLQGYQKESNNIYNLEATPAEGSLAPEEKVLISQSDPKLKEIGPLIDGYMDNNRTDIFHLNGTEILKLNKNKMFTYGFNRDSQKMSKYPVTALVRHSGQSMYEIQTVSGRKTRVTGQHSVFTLCESGRVKELPVGQITEENFVAIPKKINMDTEYKEFNLIEGFKNSSIKKYLYLVCDGEFVEDLIVKEEVKGWVKENYKTGWKDIKCVWKKSKTVPLSLIYDLDITIEKDILKDFKIFYRKSKNTHAIKTIISLDRDFGFFVGSLLSEGWISERSEFSNTDREFIDNYSKAVKEIFGVDSLIMEKKVEGRQTKQVVVLSKMIGFFLSEILDLKGKSDEKEVPSCLFVSSEEVIKGVLEGYEKGDGSIYIDEEKSDHTIRMYTNSKNLAEGLNILLLRLGILAKMGIDKKSKYNEKWKDNYVLRISGTEYLQKYYKEILGKELSRGITNSGREVIPYIPKRIKKIMQRHSLSYTDLEINKDSFNRNIRKNKISIDYLKRVVQKLSEVVEDKDVDNLKILIDSDLYWDKIKSVKKLLVPKYVYDLEVDIEGQKVNNFLGGDGLICLHNTSYRLARIDKKLYPEIIAAGREEPYYTNSTQLPVNYTDDIFEALDLQDELQTKYTGGTVFHGFIGEKISNGDACKELVKKIAYNYRMPYFTMSPTFSVCPQHGYLAGEYEYCPKCDTEIEAINRKEVVENATNQV